MTFSPFWRRLFLTVHVVSSVSLIGAVAGFLALAVAGFAASSPMSMRSAYIAMAVLTWDVIVPLAVASLVIGVIQSLVTPWGLFRHYWVIIKLALTIFAVLVLMLQMPTIDGLATAALTGEAAGAFEARISTILHASGGLLVLLTATVLSIYKPRGITRYGQGRLAGRAAG